MKIPIYSTFTPCFGENIDFHHALVKIKILMTFTPHHDENSALTMLWCKFRFSRHLHYAVVKTQHLHNNVVKIQIYTMPW